jgi:Xaa-Pro aminopeptidase
MAKAYRLDPKRVQENIEALQKFMQSQNLETFYISSFDPYLNEYVPMSDCHRFYVTNFSGSVAEVLVPKSGKVKLYVDGRYYEQADQEVDANWVEVVKVETNVALSAALLQDLKNLSPKNIGIESPRTSLSFYKKLKDICTVQNFVSELESVMNFMPKEALKPIYQEELKYCGKSPFEKLQIIIANKSEGYFITAIDSLAWLSNCRGYHLPNLSSFLGRGLAVHDKLFVFIDSDTQVEVQNSSDLEFIKVNNSKLSTELARIQKTYNLTTLHIDPNMLNASDYELVESIFGKQVLTETIGGLVKFHSLKDDVEIQAMKMSFQKANRAIYNTIKWAKDSIKNGKKISELDLYNETTKKYQAEGSREQSFNTIAGVGANGSIIHYGDPKADVYMQDGDMILLDSGGYFEGGFATDTTRTFVVGESTPHKDYIKMYTLVLKGLLQCQHAIFPEGTKGATLDAYARRALYDHGLDFAHGTGHGVGIHVHEGGVRISSISQLPMKAGQVVSIEPGLYTPGFGGVRIENIALVKKHPTFKNFLCFETLVYIGYEPKLIDSNLLTAEEKGWLASYEAECKKQGTSFSC